MVDKERNESEIVGAPQKCKEDTTGIKCAIFFANKKENFLRQHFLAQKIKDGRAQITVFSAQKSTSENAASMSLLLVCCLSRMTFMHCNLIVPPLK